MKPLVYSPEALADLAAITRYIAQDNPARARSFRAELETRAALAAERPLSFPLPSDIAPGICAVRRGGYLLLYRDMPDGVRIVRVAHGARDLRSLIRRPSGDA